ncbi:MAG TPA: hypothetical protein VHY55_09585 [Acidimicrobiia bacterium]|nr:hypothetical protein [Acidimicrobiia bacterium]
MTWADETAPVSPVSAHLEWPSAEDEDAESSDGETPPVRRFFLGQFPEDESDGVWEDEQPGGDNGGDRPADPGDDASDFEGFELPAWTDSADLDQSLDEDAPHLDLITSFEELPGPATSDADDDERPLASEVDDPTSVAIRPVPLAREQEADDVGRARRARVPRSRIVLVAAVVVVLLVSTAVYVGTRAKAEDQTGRRQTPTSVEPQSASTTGTTATTAGSSDAAPDTEPAPVSNAVSGSAAPASRNGAPQGTGLTQTRAPATGTAGAGSPPPAASSGPNASPPPPPPPPPPAPSTNPNPICQVTPGLCP